MDNGNDLSLGAALLALADLLAFAAGRVSDKDSYRKRLLKLSAQGRREDVHTTLSHSSVEQDMEELFLFFDRAFLDLFPNFILSCRRLLPTGANTSVPARGRLTSEQRIMALMSLGMSDPRQIATTLNLSVGTVYNYRSRLKAAIPSDVSLAEAMASLIA